MHTDLLTVPGVGKQTKKSLFKMGITCVEDLKGKNPEKLYEEDCKIKGFKVDRCQLYLFRMIVYYAETKNPDEEKLKWWNWKDN